MDALLPSSEQFFFVQRVLRLMAGVLLEWRVAGLAHIPRRGPLLVAVNHTSFLDVILPALFFPRPLVSFSKIEVFQTPLLGWLFEWMRMIPVRRGEVDRRALKRALDVLQRGGTVAIAPEGTRTREGKLIRAKPGVAFLLAASHAPVLPLAMWGAARGGFAANVRNLRRTRVEAVIGPPLRLRDEPVEHDERQAVADELMLHLARLLPEEMRGCYSNAGEIRAHYFEPLEPEELALLPSTRSLQPAVPGQ